MLTTRLLDAVVELDQRLLKVEDRSVLRLLRDGAKPRQHHLQPFPTTSSLLLGCVRRVWRALLGLHGDLASGASSRLPVLCQLLFVGVQAPAAPEPRLRKRHAAAPQPQAVDRSEGLHGLGDKGRCPKLQQDRSALLMWCSRSRMPQYTGVNQAMSEALRHSGTAGSFGPLIGRC